MDFKSLRCVSMKMQGDKIILPSSILEILIELEVQYPMTFELVTNNKKTHCGVLEFTADEGTCFVPAWIMKNLYLKEGDFIYIRNVALQQATFIKFKPELKFLELSDPRAVLEYTLRSFSCVTIGDKLHFDYNSKEYIMEVTEVKPKKGCCIIEADIEVDFDEPDGYISPKIENQNEQIKNSLPEPIKATSSSSELSENTKKFKPGSTKWGSTSKMAHFQGKGNKL
uniref:Ubiquitin fusion degradation protein n=1 Tax=viral metagenome TaxID=1070528 RepID=A0A6C0D3X0_9ZZZZ